MDKERKDGGFRDHQVSIEKEKPDTETKETKETKEEAKNEPDKKNNS